MRTSTMENKQMYDVFTKEVIEKLKYYVYRLIDPRNGETFYVGKGTGNRVFNHIKASLQEEENENLKLKKIREIALLGLEVVHIIHRHGLDEKTAYEVEGALIDAYQGLTNLMHGNGNSDYGVMHANEIIMKYAAPEVIIQNKVIIINVNRSALDNSLYDATRYAWRINAKKAAKADYVLSVVHGIIKGVFIAEKWLEADPINFKNFPLTNDGRYGFVGKEASSDIVNHYLNKRIPDSFRKKGASNPIKYNF